MRDNLKISVNKGKVVVRRDSLIISVIAYNI